MKEESKYSHTFQDDLDYFIKHIESLYFSLPLVMKIIGVTQKTAIETFTKFVSKLPRKNVENEEGKITFEIQAKNIRRFNKLRDRTAISNISINIIPRSFFISLISHYDAFIGTMIKNLFLIKPEKLNSSEKKFSYSELLLLDNIEDAKEFIIAQEVESVLRESHIKQIQWLEKKFDIKLTKDLPSLPEFIEATERRNIFVHNDGKINSQYIKICEANNYKFKHTPEIGNKLNVDLEYFERVFSVLFELSVKLTHVFWSKYLPQENDESAKHLTELTFNLISKENYNLSINLLEFATKYLNNHSDYDKKISKINLAQSYKWLNQNDECKKVLDSVDWSACEPTFKLCVSVLENNFIQASELMKELKTKENMDVGYQEWPVFKEFRSKDVFLTTYNEVYNKEFSISDSEDESIYDVKILRPVSKA